MDPHGPTIVSRCPTAVIADKIKHIHFQKAFYHKHPALMQPVCTTVSTPCHTGQGLAGHPRCVNMGNNYGKTRLYTPIHSKTTALPLCARHHSTQRDRSSLRAEVKNLLEKGAVEIVPPAQSKSGLYRRYFLVPPPKKKKKTLWPATYSRSQTPELRPDERSFRMITLKPILPHICGVIHKSPGRPRLEATLHAGQRSSCVGSE